MPLQPVPRIAAPGDVALGHVKPRLQHFERLHHVVGLLRRATRPDRHVRLAVFEPEQPRAGAQVQDDLRVGRLETRERRRQPLGESSQRRHHQIAGHLGAAAPEPRGELAELVVARLRHPREFFPRLGRRIATGVALKQLHPEPCLQGINMPDHRRMVHAERGRRAAHRAVARDLVGGAQFVPVLHGGSCAFANIIC